MPAGSIVYRADRRIGILRINTYVSPLQILLPILRLRNNDRKLIRRVGVTDDPLKRSPPFRLTMPEGDVQLYG